MFAWVGAAAAALVALRKGLAEGAYVVFWALLPAIAVAVMARDVGPLTMLLGTAVTAAVLRTMQYWPYALLAAVGAGLASATALNVAGQAYLAEVLAMVNPMLEQFRQQGAKINIQAGDVAAVIGVSTCLWSVLAVMLARWWQAVLFRPGGFREEMWQLRLPPTVTLILVALLLLLSNMGEVYRFWGICCALPFIVAGLALVHGVVGRLNLGRVWLVVLYVALSLVGPLWAVIMLVAVLDSWIDFRKRLPVPPEQ
ncbi:hypothetical protein IB286_02975 [Spongiibacter sp. KMU-158]|uniref:DUF2232 domain-containing protein n=1 Tax=Spongiibacter pelagi TaxID=2760804 RepID=A0A927BYL7_9GAMM|nr:hypothetical protein [Spongiibacter pelagi]MBD2857955.1 hypothetical protein [Spongiibacter pelagi]